MRPYTLAALAFLTIAAPAGAREINVKQYCVALKTDEAKKDCLREHLRERRPDLASLPVAEEDPVRNRLLVEEFKVSFVYETHTRIEDATVLGESEAHKEGELWYIVSIASKEYGVQTLLCSGSGVHTLDSMLSTGAKITLELPGPQSTYGKRLVDLAPLGNCAGPVLSVNGYEMASPE